MQKFKFFLIGSGLFWIFAWSVFGSILGAKINLVVMSGVDTNWLTGIEKSLLTAAHSHMNNMAITLIVFALTISYLKGFISNKIIKIVCSIHLISIPFFGIGMLLEAVYPPTISHFSFPLVLVSLGAVFYMLTMAIWSSFFMLAFLKSH